MSFCSPKTWHPCRPQSRSATLPEFKSADTRFRKTMTGETIRQSFKAGLSPETLHPPTSAELRLLWDPEVLTIQWMYEESRPSTFMSTRCCWRAKTTTTQRPYWSVQRRMVCRSVCRNHGTKRRVCDLWLCRSKRTTQPVVDKCGELKQALTIKINQDAPFGSSGRSSETEDQQSSAVCTIDKWCPTCLV